MARSVTFNGITRFKPGGITKVNAEALNQVTAGDNSVVALIGEADGGAPGSVSVVALDDSSRARSLFKSGPLVDAIRLAFQSSNDPDVPGGASRVLVYKTNASTQASLSLPGPNATQLVDSSATGGSTTTVVDTTLASTYADDYFNGKVMVLRPFTATAEVRTITDYVESTNTFTVSPAFAGAAMAADVYRVFDSEAEVMDAVNAAGSTSTLVAVKDADFTDDQHNGRWVYIQDTATVSYLRQIADTDGTGETITVSPALPATPTAGAYVMILPNVIDLTSIDYGAHTNGITVDVGAGVGAGTKVLTVAFEGQSQVSPDVGGRLILKVLYKGGSTSISDTVAANSTTTSIQLTAGGLTPSAHVGKQVKIGSEYTVITANTAGELTVSPALSEAPDTGTAVLIQSVLGGTMNMAGAAGLATTFTTSLSGVTGDNLNIVVSSSMTLRELINQINQNLNYQAVAGDGINADVVLASSLDFGPDATASILASPAIAVEGLKRDVSDMVDYINEFSSYLSASRSTDTGSTVAGSQPPQNLADPLGLSGGTRGISANSSFQSGFDEMLLHRANSVVPLIDQDLVNEGQGSTATWASVAAQLSDHVTVARGASQEKAGERGGFIGFRGNKTQVIAKALSINNYDVHLLCQNPTVLDAFGNLAEKGPREFAVMAASMRAGVAEVGEPLTHKFIRVSGVTQDASWDPADTTDANDLIKAGVLFSETISGEGTKWVRDLTTWVADDNLAYMEGSVRDVVRYVAYNLRTGLVRRFTGRKAAPATIASIKDACSAILDLMRQGNIIVDSTDPATGAVVRAWHNLKVTSSGDTVTVKVGIFPVTGINFVLNEIFLQLPTQAA